MDEIARRLLAEQAEREIDKHCREDIYQLTDDEIAPDFDALRKDISEKYAATLNRLADIPAPPAGAPTPYYWQLVDLARDLCRAAGHDPDQRVLDTQNAQRGPLGSTLVSATVPAWTLYIEAAENVKGALNG